jgi:hypothetical protein
MDCNSYTVVPDPDRPKMYRVRRPDGSPSDCERVWPALQFMSYSNSLHQTRLADSRPARKFLPFTRFVWILPATLFATRPDPSDATLFRFLGQVPEEFKRVRST